MWENAIEFFFFQNHNVYISCILKQRRYLSESSSWGPWNLVESVDGYADHRGQSHGEANSQGPAGIHVVIVGDGLVLDHCEDQDELRGTEDTVNE